MGPKITYLGIFGLQFNKSYYQIFNQSPQIYETTKFHPKQKNIPGIKNALFGSLSWNVEKLFSRLKSVPSNLRYCKVWSKKQKSLNLGPKMVDFSFFGGGLDLKILLSYLKLPLSNLPNCKVS